MTTGAKLWQKQNATTQTWNDRRQKRAYKTFAFRIRHPVSAGYSGSPERPSRRNHQKMMEVEMEERLGYEKSERSDNDD